MLTLWTRFKATPLGELLTGTAHETHGADITAPLGVRFAGKSILALHVALDKSATVRIRFDASGTPTIGGVRNLSKRGTKQFTQELEQEARAAQAEWVLVVLLTGWTAVLGQRSSRPEAGEPNTAFFRHKLMFETPEVVFPRTESTKIYTAVDHPFVDKSVVFSVPRRVLTDLFAELRAAGLGLAGVKIGVAAQLEAWLALKDEAVMARDLLVTDSLSSLVLNVNAQSQNFEGPVGGESDMPRQSSNRPTAIVEDIKRHIETHPGPITLVGSEDVCSQITAALPNLQFVRRPDFAGHDVQKAVLLPQVHHDLNYDARELRPAVPRRWRRYVIGYLVLLVVGLAAAAINAVHVLRASYTAYRIEQEDEARATRSRTANDNLDALYAEYANASLTRSWLASNFHAQQLCYSLVREIPTNVTVDRMAAEAKDGQLVFTFVVLGDNTAIFDAKRAVEKTLTDLHFKIGRQEAPVNLGGAAKGVQFRMYIIIPDAGEVAREGRQ